MDDWYIGFENAGQAEDAIATIAMACRNFELELNSEKTRTLHAASETDTIWATDLTRIIRSHPLTLRRHESHSTSGCADMASCGHFAVAVGEVWVSVGS